MRNPVERHAPLLLDGAVITMIEPIPGFECGDVKTMKRVGLGTHAEVYEVQPIRPSGDGPPLTFAMKVEKPIKKASGLLMKEIEIIKAISHLPSVPKYLGAFVVTIADVECLAFGLELFDDSLSSLKQSRRDVPASHHTQLVDWLSVEMMTVVLELHDCGFLHRDIKPSNFMYKLTPEGIPRLALVDFGSSIAVGEANGEAGFRGTGAYTGIDADADQSQPVDDHWSVAFSLLDLCIPGGLPWRALSARTDEGRLEIQRQKVEILERIKKDEVDGILESVTPRVEDILCALYDGSDLRNEVGSLDHRHSAGSMATIVSLLRPSTRTKQIAPASMLNGACREEISRTRVSVTAFGVDNDGAFGQSDFKEGVVSVLSSLQTSSLCVFEGQRVCLAELLTGTCPHRIICPLLHIPARGIALSAITRWIRINSICVESSVGKCPSRKCTSGIHLNKHIIESIYRDGTVPADLAAIKQSRNP